MSMPMFIHSQTPPSVPAMKENRAEISWIFGSREGGLNMPRGIYGAFQVALKHDFSDGIAPSFEIAGRKKWNPPLPERRFELLR